MQLCHQGQHAYLAVGERGTKQCDFFRATGARVRCAMSKVWEPLPDRVDGR